MNAITSHYPGSFEEAFSVQHLAGKPIRKTRAFEMKWWNYKSFFQIYFWWLHWVMRSNFYRKNSLTSWIFMDDIAFIKVERSWENLLRRWYSNRASQMHKKGTDHSVTTLSPGRHSNRCITLPPEITSNLTLSRESNVSSFSFESFTSGLLST